MWTIRAVRGAANTYIYLATLRKSTDADIEGTVLVCISTGRFAPY
jgi:hypothetical protein